MMNPCYESKYIALDRDVIFCNPELVTTCLLQDALAAARRAIAIGHPNVEDAAFEFRDADHCDRLAFFLLLQLVDIGTLLDQYHRSVDNNWRSHQIALPF